MPNHPTTVPFKCSPWCPGCAKSRVSGLEGPARIIDPELVAHPVIRRLFWERVEITGPDDCWLWKGSTIEFGYGTLKNNQTLQALLGTKTQKIRAHRLSHAIHGGTWPEGHVTRHTCDNPPCVNPTHLTTGTTAENINDAVERGRIPKGSSRPFAKLDEEFVADARKRFQNGEDINTIHADRPNIAKRNFYAAINRKTWKHVP